jgi:hypothetical protein
MQGLGSVCDVLRIYAQLISCITYGEIFFRHHGQYHCEATDLAHLMSIYTYGCDGFEGTPFLHAEPDEPFTALIGVSAMGGPLCPSGLGNLLCNICALYLLNNLCDRSIEML